MKKRSLTSFLSVILVILLLTGLCACGSASGPADPTQAETTSDVTAPLPSDASDVIVIAEGSKIRFKLVRPEEVTDEFFRFFSEIRDELDALTGGSIKCDTDFTKRNEEPDTKTYEILIGNCNRYETEEVKSSLGINDWSVSAVDRKIVVFGHSAETLKDAVSHFLGQSLKKTTNDNGDIFVTYSGDYTYRDDAKMLFTEERPLSGYTIVYGAKNAYAETAAKKLQTRLQTRYGYDVPVVSDASPEVDCEILIGETNRSEAESAFRGLSETEYCIKTTDTKLVIGAPNEFATTNGMADFLGRYLDSTLYTDVLNFETGYSEHRFAYYSKESNALYGDSDLRIMSWNMLTELWDDKVPVEGRDVLASAAIRYYAPDVVGIQEVTTAWYNGFEKYLPTYRIVTRVNQHGKASYTSLIYNTDTVKLVNSGVRNFSKGASTMRLITWGLFERLSDGERFVVTSTHWDINSNISFVEIQAKEMAEVVNELARLYGVPIFCTGDYNRKESEPQFILFLDKTGFVNPMNTAKKVNRTGKTYHSSVGTMPTSGDAIDHILCSPSADVLFYNIIHDRAAIDASDHCPIYIDVKLADEITS